MDNSVSQPITPSYGLKSVTGPRDLNEDSAFIREYIARARQQRYMCMAAVADGMGGHQAGEVASSTAVQSLFEEFSAQKISYDRDPSLDTRQLLHFLFSQVNTTVYDIARRDNKLKGMGTTLTVFLAEGDKAYVAHVGDSRAYLIRGGSIVQMTEDHTLVQDMVRDKIITREQAGARSDRNIITRAIGVDQTVEVDIISFPIQPGDILFLCSDGLYDMVSNHEILVALTKSGNLQHACQELVQHALDNGTSDNVSAIAWEVPDIPWERPQTATARPAKSSTGTVALPPEREYEEVLQRPPAGKERNKKIVLAVVFAAVIIAGFILGWLLAGWVKGDSEESGLDAEGPPAAEQIVESQAAELDLRSQTTVILLNALGTEGNADSAKKLIDNLGYEKIVTGDALGDNQTYVYYDDLDDSEKAKQIMDDLGLENVVPHDNKKVFDDWQIKLSGVRADVVVVLPYGWSQ